MIYLFLSLCFVVMTIWTIIGYIGDKLWDSQINTHFVGEEDIYDKYSNKHF